MTRKILINKEYGGFGLSDTAIETYLIRSNIPYEKKERQVASLLLDKMFFFTVDGKNFTDRDIPRDDLILIKIAEEMGLEAVASKFCELKIVEIPADQQNPLKLKKARIEITGDKLSMITYNEQNKVFSATGCNTYKRDGNTIIYKPPTLIDGLEISEIKIEIQDKDTLKVSENGLVTIVKRVSNEKFGCEKVVPKFN